MMMSSIFFIIFASLWACHYAASDTLKPGDTLNSSSSLVSASGKFILHFVVQTIDGSNTSYLAILRNKPGANKAWIGNRNTPIPYPSSPLLILDLNNTLKITYPGGDPIVISSAPQTSVVVATLLDSGNFVLQEVNSVNKSTSRVLWQSFDYPTDTFLPGMKLGVDHRNGHNWSLLSWATSYNPAPGPLSLDWDPNGHQLRIKQAGVVYWSSGIFGDGRFEFIFPDVSKQRYNFSIVSNENEDYLTYTAVGDPSDPEPEWVLYSRGTLFEYGTQVAITKALNCDGYNTDGGCVRRDRPSGCTAKFGDEFEKKNGYFKINNSSNTSRSPNWFNASSSDCKVTCWQNCDCLGFDLPPANQSQTSTGCQFWSVESQFFEDLNSSSSFVLSGLATPAKPPPPAQKNDDEGHKWLWIGIAIAAAVLVMVFCILGYLLRRRICSGKNRAMIQNKMPSFMKSNRSAYDPVNELQKDHGNMGKHDLSVFTYESVLAATSNFSQENKLGEGGFGPVYKGKLAKGQEIAVKRLSKRSGQGTSEFKNELILIHELQHTNLVQLFGFCIHEEERMLIYELQIVFFVNSLCVTDSIRGVLLDWKKRFNIIEGITQGLLYLHKYSRTRVIHRDLKASNILLDENMNPKISDFGMARIFTHNALEENTSRIVGTRGYMAPETIEGIVSVKSDVYSFGVLVLEIISGRKNNSFYNDDRILNLVGYAWELWKENAGLELMDPTLSDSCIGNQLLRCIHVGLLCVEENAADRPTMSDVISMLTNESMQLPKPTKPAYYTEGNTDTAGIALMMNSIIFLIFACLWTCQDAASDTLKPGDTLNSSSSLVSASGKFILCFVVQTSSNTSYLAILHNKPKTNKAWIGNRNTPIPYPSSPLLTLDLNNTLKVTQTGQDSIPIFSAPQTSDPVVATLLDSGNLIVQELNPVDGSTKRVLWQSFDYPVDTFLPGMKLGVNRSNGHIWSLLAWADTYNPAPGPFTLDWDPNERQLKIRKSGVVYWTSGVLRSDGRFEFILPNESKQRYNFSIVSNESEECLKYSAVDDQSEPEPELVLYSEGRLHDYGGPVDIVLARNCDGYNTDGGCVRRDRPNDCVAKVGDDFELKNGVFKPKNLSSRSPYWFDSNIRHSGTRNACKATCWKNCTCLGFNFPISDNQTTSSTGCQFWSVDSEFVEENTGSSTATSGFVFSSLISSPKSTPRKNTGQKWIWIGTSSAGAALMLLVLCQLLRRRRLTLPTGESRTNIENEMLNFMKSNRPTDHVGLQNDGKMGHQDLSVFSYASVLAATSNFSEENKLGQGGFGPVYKGKLATGQEIAVKRLRNVQGKEPQSSRMNPNRRLLLDWKKRFGILEGIAQGLLYLHKYSRKKVIHRDLKTSNILLDENLNPKISDFGMARIFTNNELEANTSKIVGTRGYMPPESMEGIVSVKSDVYGFGVLMLEIISGRRNNSFYNDDRALSLVGYAWELWKEGAGLELMDPTVGDSCINDQVLRCIHVGLLCVEEDAADRPTMKLVEAGVGGKQPEIASVNDLSNSDFDAR
ncbi:unnamed protein product [Prunus armeniaca]|uniref:non-specific serine/threonine protein kinase n=1 Tax=Prunus armeniaca TaxID=36596 RepID=A0A6J5UKI3_PRUAR|nr:unnamed protein product [Prunus armeniaca]